MAEFKVSFPIDKEVSLVLVAPEGYQAAEGSHTVLLAAEQFAGALATLAAKDRHYGGAWREQGWMGNLARIQSKAARLRNMLWRDITMDDDREPVSDTVQDMINLLVFLTLNRNVGNKWGRGDV